MPMGAPSFSGGRDNKGSEVFDTEKMCQLADDLAPNKIFSNAFFKMAYPKSEIKKVG
jgi:hypothetical protein